MLSRHQRFFSAFRSSSPIDIFFNSLVQKDRGLSMNQELKSSIILNFLALAKAQQTTVGALAKRDAKLPLNWPLKKKLDFIKSTRSEFYASPVLTAHPTEVLSDEIQIKIQDFVKQALYVEELEQTGQSYAEELAKLRSNFTELLSHSFLPAEALSPEQEMLRQNRLYLDMMESWPKFNQANIQAFASNHQVELSQVAHTLTQINQYSYRNVGSWSIADIDGNQRRTRQTMEKMESSLQVAIIDRYLSKIEPLVSGIPQLFNVVAYLKRCQQAIADGIYFNLEGAHIAKKRLIKILTELRDQTLFHDELQALIDFVDMVGFRGDLKQFVRQSSHMNAQVFQNFVDILRDFDPKLAAYQQLYGAYQNWSLEAKTELHHLFRTRSEYFRYLKEQYAALSPATVRELDILNFVRVYQDQFSYILSDTKDYHSLDEVVILFGFAAYCHHQLYIDDIKRPPVNLIPLCETPKDLENLPVILDAMLSNPYLKQVMLARRELIYVAGPSDLGKEGGIFAHFDLIEAEKKAMEVLTKHQRIDTRLTAIRLRVLYGLGSDFHRRVSLASSQLFSTFQGSDACLLGSVGAYQAMVETVSGQQSENTLRARQLQAYAQQYPADYRDLKTTIKASIQAYRQFIFSPASLELFRSLAMPYQLGRLMNTSSRAESKTAVAPDITKSRAIGIANYEVSSLFLMRIFMSADGLIELSPELQAKFPSFYQNSIVMQELVLKIFFAFAVSRSDLAIQKIFAETPSAQQIEEFARIFQDPKMESSAKGSKHALAYILSRASSIFAVLIKFMSPSQQALAMVYLQKHQHEDMSKLALGLIQVLGYNDQNFANLHHELVKDLLPRYQVLAQALQTYANADTKTELLAENVVLALRGDKKIMAGPQCIAKMSLMNSVNKPSVAAEEGSSSTFTYRSSILNP